MVQRNQHGGERQLKNMDTELSNVRVVHVMVSAGGRGEGVENLHTPPKWETLCMAIYLAVEACSCLLVQPRRIHVYVC